MFNSIHVSPSKPSWCGFCENRTDKQPYLYKPSKSQFTFPIKDAASQTEGWLLTRCQVCGVISVDPLPSEKELLLLYKRGYYVKETCDGGIGNWMMQKALKESSRSWPWSKWSQRRIHSKEVRCLRYLSKLVLDIPRAPRFLDVGCGMGEVLVAARELGWKGMGIEVSETAAKRASQKSGLPVICGTLEALSPESNVFDIIHLREVLEHVREPGAYLRYIADLLRPGGVLYVQVPNDLGGYRSRLFSKVWWIFPPVHLHYFTPTVLSEALANFGLNVVSAGSMGDAIGIDLRRYFFWRLNLLSFADQLQKGKSLGGIALKLYQSGWDHGLFWPAGRILNCTMCGFAFWLVARKTAFKPLK